MKITSDMSKNFLKYYNEAAGINTSKRKILRTKNTRCLNYFTKLIIIYFSFIIFSLFLLINGNKEVFGLYVIILIIIIVLSLFRLIITIYYRKNNGLTKTVIIDEKGLTGEFFDGLTITFSWKKLKAVIIKKYTIVILTDRKVFFYFTINEKKEVLKAIQKYQPSFLIIENKQNKK